MSSNTDSSKKPNMLSMMFSVLAAFFGVQSEKNRVRDFSNGNPWPFIAIGVIFAVIFVLGLVAIVNIVLATAT
ncbi:hypothetical protein A10D4_05572 [Idiomarina xiamenensis 10-D-4]|uniref:DUF2970 domain-containing protein n=2 Tax=Idiomarina xiamenensis TaxID=1207041 RepID=K2KCU4_9GAMM|nr:hypothetical protein A10D4_05572 [Idiomarina xiamenensis 10-D-4]